MKYSAWFQCFKGCPDRFPLTEVIYRCPRCGDLLEVAHDVDALAARPAAEWTQLFDDRYMTTQWPYGSGVWGKKELVHPTIDDDNVVSLYEGGSNLFWAERFGSEIGLEDLWIKQCGNSHSGSFKDLGITVLVSAVKDMIASGTDIEAVVCASTGDTSASLAAYCAAAGIPTVVALPNDKISRAQLIQPMANGAVTLSLNTDFDGCMEIVRRLSEDSRFYLANSVNPLRIEGQKTVSIEMVQQFDWEVPDWVIVPGGNLGNVSAIGNGFTLMKRLGIIDRLPRLVCAQVEAANPLYRSYVGGFESHEPMTPDDTLATAIQIGNPVSIDKAIAVLREFDGIVEQASENELSHAAGWADRTGLFTCPQTGVALGALLKLVERGTIGAKDRVIVVSTASGLKFTDFKAGYLAGDLPGVDSAYESHPIELPGDYDVVVKAVEKAIA